MPVLRNPRHEKFSQLVASGIKPREAYVSVEYKPTGAKQAASRLLTKVDVRERVSELQQAAARSTAEAVILNRERVLNRLSQLSHEAQQTGHYSAAARCEELIGKEIGMFVDRSTLLWETDPDRMTPDQLDCIAERLLQKALAGQPEGVVVEARRRIQAGETPTIEELTQDVTEGSLEPKS
jgi:hypothetical protein